MRNNKDPSAKPCGTRYFQSLIIYGSILSFVTEPIKSYASDATMTECGKKDIMISSIEAFLQIYKDTTGKAATVKSILYHFYCILNKTDQYPEKFNLKTFCSVQSFAF